MRKKAQARRRRKTTNRPQGKMGHLEDSSMILVPKTRHHRGRKKKESPLAILENWLGRGRIEHFELKKAWPDIRQVSGKGRVKRS